MLDLKFQPFRRLKGHSEQNGVDRAAVAEEIIVKEYHRVDAGPD